ncbi:flagellin domain-containing protein [Niallia circulans]|uniref:flagellin N-terminal helical domain-containing protein n=1 Tax=Niallia circulans TaxID=1397 RepID=UPI00077C245E|nr:flagellin [Niallia circulans]MDR4316316.1 flagellin [Niallia circulans]MED3838514.1 flagellin [Niallia circulans]MED4243987.1 flagellin [Niallia circulans]MED4246381.1 flagellin [Niallia circulans]QKH62988.1 flagellin [Niallia circulans]
MIINHNLSAMNTYRQMGANQTNASKSMEKLSSGLRINRAGDDAAGLAISEKMRGQISGLNQAQRNSQDGISLIQTAEGALNETHSILQRMRELATQAANDTNTDQDRQELQKELNQLTSEINRIGNNTEFNQKKLLNGSQSLSSGNRVATAGNTESGNGLHLQVGANSQQNFTVDIFDMRAEALGIAGTAGSTAQIGQSTQAGQKNAWVTGGTAGTEDYNSASGATVTGANKVLTENGTTIGAELVAKSADSKFASGAANKLTDAGNATGAEVYALDISDHKKATSAISTIDAAINQVSAERSKLGAFQNRLEHTISNLGNSSENLQSAESRVRDVDMAKEMMEMTKSNILSQASQSMLAQANQRPQAVLQLLG